jgi:hypothetical protein
MVFGTRNSELETIWVKKNVLEEKSMRCNDEILPRTYMKKKSIEASFTESSKLSKTPKPKSLTPPPKMGKKK